MKDILLIGGPATLSGVERINGDLLSILTEPHLYDRKAVIVWPTSEFLAPPADTDKLHPYVDMHDARWQVIERRGMAAALKGLTSEQIKNLATTAKLDHKDLRDAVTQDAMSQGVFRLAKLSLAVSGGQNLLVIVDQDAPEDSLCWSRLVSSWGTDDGVEVKNYSSGSTAYGVLTSVKEWGLVFKGSSVGTMPVAKLLPKRNVEIRGINVSMDKERFADTPEALEVIATVSYPVVNRFGSPKAVQVDSGKGFMLVIPKPDKPKNFIIGLKTGRGVEKAPKLVSTESKSSVKADSYMTRSEVAVLLKIQERTVDRYIKSGKLTSTKVGGNVRILKSSVDMLVGS
jgi:excisionase family DNA binding protein